MRKYGESISEVTLANPEFRKENSEIEKVHEEPFRVVHWEPNQSQENEKNFRYRSSKLAEVYLLWRDGELPLGAFPGSTDSTGPNNAVINFWFDAPMKLAQSFMLRVNQLNIEPYTDPNTGKKIEQGTMSYRIGDDYAPDIDEYYNTQRIPIEEIEIAMLSTAAEHLMTLAYVISHQAEFEKLFHERRNLGMRLSEYVPLKNYPLVLSLCRQNSKVIQSYVRIQNRFSEFPDLQPKPIEDWSVNDVGCQLTAMENQLNSVNGIILDLLRYEFGATSEHANGYFYSIPRKSGSTESEPPIRDAKDIEIYDNRKKVSYYFQPAYYNQMKNTLRDFFKWLSINVPIIKDFEDLLDR